MLLRGRLTINILRHTLHLLYSCPFLSLGLFVLYLCDLLFIFSIILIAINHMTSLKETHLSFVRFLEYFLLFLDDNVN